MSHLLEAFASGHTIWLYISYVHDHLHAIAECSGSDTGPDQALVTHGSSLQNCNYLSETAGQGGILMLTPHAPDSETGVWS